MASQMVGGAAFAAFFMLVGCGADGSATPSTAAESTNEFTLASPDFVDGGELPIEFTCDGASLSPSLTWSGTPQGTVSFAIAMHHVPGPGDTHWYWVLYGIDASIHQIDAGATPAAMVGTNSVNGLSEYAPPCSQGPGAKEYTITIYALSAVPKLPDPSVVTRDVLLAAIDGIVIADSHIVVTYERS